MYNKVGRPLFYKKDDELRKTILRHIALNLTVDGQFQRGYGPRHEQMRYFAYFGQEWLNLTNFGLPGSSD